MYSSNTSFRIVLAIELFLEKIILALIDIYNTGTEKNTEAADARFFVEKELIGADGVSFVGDMFDG